MAFRFADPGGKVYSNEDIKNIRKDKIFSQPPFNPACYYTLPPEERMKVRAFDFRVHLLPTNKTHIFAFYNTEDWVSLCMDSSGVLSMIHKDIVIGTSVQAISVDKWYLIEVSYPIPVWTLNVNGERWLEVEINSDQVFDKIWIGCVIDMRKDFAADFDFQW